MNLRRTPMRRGTSTLNRGSRIAPISDRTRDRIPDRKAARHASLLRAGMRCEMAALIPEIPKCSPYNPVTGVGLEVDEIEGRGAHPGTQYDDSFQQVGCHVHHEWKTLNPKLAEDRGLRRKSSFERRRNMLDE